jgi:hypothetical protein
VTSKWAERARSSPYYPALSHPVFRRVLPGTAASALGDGMSAVAIAWLAIELAPPAAALGLVGGLALAGLLDLPLYVALLGARGTLLVSALATIALGLVTVAALLLARRAR